MFRRTRLLESDVVFGESVKWCPLIFELVVFRNYRSGRRRYATWKEIFSILMTFLKSLAP